MRRAVLGVLPILLLTSPLQDRERSPRTPLQVGLRIVDPEWETEPDPVLERLAGEELAVEALERAVGQLATALGREGIDGSGTRRALRRAGTIAHLGGDQRTAEVVLEALVGACRRSPGEEGRDLADALFRRGLVARYKGDYPLARRYYDEAELILARAVAPPVPLLASLEQARADWKRGDGVAATLPAYRRALAMRRASLAYPSYDVADNLVWFSWSLDRAGQRREAGRLIPDARRELAALGLQENSLNGTLDELAADQAALRGDWGEAERMYRRAARTFDRQRRRYLGGFSRRIVPLDGNEGLAAMELRRGEKEAAWQDLQRARGAIHLDFLTLARWSKIEPPTFGERRRTQRRALEVRDSLDDAKKAGAWTPHRAGALLEWLELLAKRSHLERDFLNRHRPPPPTSAEIRQLLGPRRAMVGWLHAVHGGYGRNDLALRGDIWAYVLRPDRPLAWVRLWPHRGSSALDEWTAGFKRSQLRLAHAASWPERVDPDPELLQDLKLWSQRSFDPLRHLLQGIDQIVFEGTQEPVALLIGPDGRFLAEEFDISHVPAAAALAFSRPGPSRWRSALVLASGATPKDRLPLAARLSSAENSLSIRGNRSFFPRADTVVSQLPALPLVGAEAMAVGNRFARHRVVSGRARPASLMRDLAHREELSEFDVLHVAAHTLTAGAPEQCAWAFPGEGEQGVLDAEEIVLGWDLDCELVTLSGCMTATAAGVSRREPIGFTPALFGAGASRILSSLWPVDDAATALLMDRFYGHLLQEHLTPAGALRRAVLEVRQFRDASGRRPFEHPAYWGGFVLMGP